MQCDEVMRQDELTEGLSSAQAAAVEALLAGKTVTAAASAAGVGRATVYRWLKDDFAFQAELNRGRRDLRRAAFGNLERLAAKATDCLEKAIDQGDLKAALEVLNRLRIFAPDSIGSEDPAELAMEAENAAADRQDDLEMSAAADEWDS